MTGSSRKKISSRNGANIKQGFHVVSVPLKENLLNNETGKSYYTSVKLESEIKEITFSTNKPNLTTVGAPTFHGF